jgi:hypothetical protein
LAVRVAVRGALVPAAAPSGRGWFAFGPLGETIGRSSTFCSREQIGQFWIRRLWRQNVGMLQ